MKKQLLLITLLAVATLPLSARTWTNDKGKTVQGDFVRMDGDDYVILKIGKKEHRLYIWKLSKQDRDWLEANKDKPLTPKEDNESSAPAEEKKPAPTAGAVKAELLGVALKKGKNIIPMDTSGKAFRDENKEHSKKSSIILYLPEGFDPTKQYNIMVTTASSSGSASQAGSIGPFGNRGIAHGWVVMTADSVKGRPPNFGINYRLQMLDAALDYMHEEWPASKTWNLAAGGSSGGAKAAQSLLMHLGNKKWGEHRIVGLFLSGCNAEFITKIKRNQSVGRKQKRDVAIFFSQGKKDTVATPASGKAVLEKLKKDGMRTQRYEEHDGGHGMHGQHIDDAYKWFNEHVANLDAK